MTGVEKNTPLKITLGEYLIRLLESYEVEHVFGIPGVHTVELYRGLANSSIKHHTPRHEQGAGFMADGYARLSGKPGVCFVITGPGLTNISTAMAQAYSDSIPMLVISGVNRLKDIGHGNGNLHEMPNQSAFAEQVSSFSYSVAIPDDLPRAIARAFALFNSSRPRPVHIEIPVDLMSASVDHLMGKLTPVALKRPAPSIRDMDDVVELCGKSSFPLLIIGGGVRNCGDKVQALAERLDSPVVMTINARGILNGQHPLAIPASPSLQATRELIKQSDLVLAFGTEIGPTDFDMYCNNEVSIAGTLVRFDIDPLQLQRNVQPDIAIISDAAKAIDVLLDKLEEKCNFKTPKNGDQRAAKTRNAALGELPLDMHRQLTVLNTIKTTLPGVVIVGDSTQPVYAGNLYYASERAKGWINSATGFGTLGYALSAAIGAKLAAAEQPIVCMTGDGGLQFNLGELGTAKDCQTNIIVLVWNNRGYKEIKTFMMDNGITPEGVDPSAPDFIAIAKAYGFHAEQLDNADDLPSALKRAAAASQPSLIQIDETLFSHQQTLSQTVG